MLKIFLWIAGLALLAVSCSAPAPRGGASPESLEGPGQTQTTGHASSDPNDYRQVLSDPGPF